MKRLGLLALVLGLCLVVVLIVALTREPSPEVAPGPESAAVAAQEAPQGEPRALSGLEPEAPEVDAASRSEVAAVEHAGPGLEAWDAAGSLWVEGVVRGPAGCSDEGPIEVVATASPIDANALDAQLREKHPRGLLARRAVAADGTFRLPFPPGTERGHVSVRGRYLHLEESVAVDVRGGAAKVAIDAKCGAWITGIAALPVDSPVAVGELDGLDVMLRASVDGFRGSPMAMSPLRRTAKLADGKFEFRGVPADATPALEASPERLAAVSTRLDELAGGRENPVRLDLLRGGRVTGVVRDADGRPLAGAEVAASRPGQWFGFDNREVREAKSDAEGAFELPAVAPGKVILTASLAGYLESDRKTIELADGGSHGGVELALTRGNSVAGKVAWPDGKPAVGVEVEIDFDVSQMAGMRAFNALRGREGKATTDAEGAFTVTGLGDGPFVADARAPAPGSAPAPPAPEKEEAKASDDEEGSGSSSKDRSTWWRARVAGIEPGRRDLALVLREPAGVAGRVQDETGAPVAKFRIEAGLESAGPMGAIRAEEREKSFEDAEGRFLLEGLTEGSWKLYAIADGFGLPDGVVVDVPRGKDAPELVVTIVHASSVAGIVKSPGGQPVAGAKVTIEGDGPNWQQMMRGGPRQPVATSEADGTFVLDGLRAGTSKLVATAAQYAKSLPIELTLEAGKRVEGAEIVLRSGGTLTGEVYGDSGRPATGMFVQATQMKDFDMQMTFTDDRGEFRVENLLPGSWQVVAMPSRQADDGGGDGQSPSANVADMMSKMKMAVTEIVEGQETHVVLGAPPKNPVAIRGSVTHGGEPLPGVMVAFMAEGGKGLESLKTATVKEDGSYALRLDGPGQYSVSVQRLSGGMGEQSTVEFTQEVPEVEEHRVDLVMPNARISGRVLDDEGEPAAGARISLHPETPVQAGTIWGGQYHEGVTDSDGRYDVQMLRAGTYVIGAGGTTMAGLLGDKRGLGRQMRSGLKLSEGEWMKDVDFRLKKAGAVEVTVVDAAGSPVAEAAVFVREADGRLVDGFSMVATAEGGKATYPGLGPGRYTASARKDLLTSVEGASFEVDEDETVAVQVGLQPGTILVVSTVGEESAPMRASVSVQDEQGREVGMMFSLAEVMKLFTEGGISSTEHRVGPLPQGKYKVKATSVGGKTTTKQVSLSGQPERKLTVRFD